MYTLDQLNAALARRYVLERELGSGGMAIVYLGQDMQHDRPVAVKVLREELTASVSHERFLREIQVSAVLQHPNVVPLYDSGRVDDILYYVMPRVEGQSLREWMERERQLPLDDVVAVTGGVAAAMDYAHAQGVVHRDIKPENILLHAGQPMVTDFGIARALDADRSDRLTTEGLLVGTPLYMSPEQAIDDQEVGPRSDQYGLATVVYEMVTGQPPFRAPTPLATIARRLSEAAPPPRLLRSHVPEAMERAILKALSREPADRFESCESLTRALAKGIEETAPDDRRLVTPAVAVLPFVNQSADPENEIFSDGITDEIIATLSRSASLRVTPRTTAYAFKNKAQDVREIGRQLAVDALLEGTVRRAGPRVRITAQLVDIAAGYPLWSDRYDRQLHDVFQLQDEIAAEIARVLEAELVAGPSVAGVPAPRGRGYESYLKGRYHANRRTETDLRKAVEFFRQALTLNADDTLAQAGLADALVLLGIYGAEDPADVMPQARDAARAVLKLRPSMAEAHTSLAAVSATYEWDWAGAERHISRALELAPRYPIAHHWYATTVLLPLARFDAAAEALGKASSLDPLSPAVNATHGLLHHLARRYDRAVTEYEGTLESDPHFALAHYFLGLTLDAMESWDEAIAAFDQAITLSGGSPEMTAMRARSLAGAGRGDAATAALHELMDLAERRYVSPALTAQVRAALGDTAGALVDLERAADGKAADLVWLKVRHTFDPLRGEPRFQSLLTRTGLS